MSIITKKLGQLEILTAAGITAPHCFTTRFGGVSEGYLDSLNIGIHRGDEWENVLKNYEILGSTLGFDLGKVVLSHQTHTDIVRQITDADHLGLDHHQYPECDGLITNTPGVALVVFTADCTDAENNVCTVFCGDFFTHKIGVFAAEHSVTAAE